MLNGFKRGKSPLETLYSSYCVECVFNFEQLDAMFTKIPLMVLSQFA